MQNKLFKHRVYKDYNSLYNHVLRNINSCETNEQLHISSNIFEQGLKILLNYSIKTDINTKVEHVVLLDTNNYVELMEDILK